MKSIFFDCPTGLSGDMLMASLLDLGVPKNVIDEPLYMIGLHHFYDLIIEEEYTHGIRGKKVLVNYKKSNKIRTWKEIKQLINSSSWDESLIGSVLSVFNVIAESEAIVHGIDIDNVHFHEIGAIDSIVDIVAVCAAIKYLRPDNIFCSIPPSGSGFVESSHGILPVPVPAVLELARKNRIKLASGSDYPKGELTTPTGLALMIILANKFESPSSYVPISTGVGIGNRKLDRPNLLRAIEYLVDDSEDIGSYSNEVKWESIVEQEAWIDDSSSEDISTFIEQLRINGAIEVISHPVLMKKNRTGFNIKALVSPAKAKLLREVWFSLSVTIGLKEKIIGRWILSRRKGTCLTKFGKIIFKQVKRPNGRISMKPEHDELVRVSNNLGVSISEVYKEVILTSKEFIPNEEWS